MLWNTVILLFAVCCIGCLHSYLSSRGICAYLLVCINFCKVPLPYACLPTCQPACQVSDWRTCQILEMFTVFVNGHGWHDLVFAKRWWCDIMTDMFLIIPCGCNQRMNIEFQYLKGISLCQYVCWWIGVSIAFI